MTGFPGDVPLRSAFADVLETILRDTPPGDLPSPSSDDGAHVSFDFLQALDGVSAARPDDEPIGTGSPHSAYDVTAALEPHPRRDPEHPSAAAQEPAPPHLEPCDPDVLARELGLRPGLTRRELTRLRRDFALRNHPDRLDASRRDVATRRMTLANTLIDTAIKLVPQRP